MSDTERTWQTVCTDCANHLKPTCLFAGQVSWPDDCIASVCDGFVRKEKRADQPAHDEPASERPQARPLP